MTKQIIVGIGNQYRGDDGVGLAVIDDLHNKLPIKLVKSRGDISDLIDIFSHHDTVYLIDACLLDAPIGS